MDPLACLFSRRVDDEALGGFRSCGFYVEGVQTMSSLGQEVDTDGVEPEEAIYQRLKIRSLTKMTREGSDGQSDVSEQYCDHGGIQCQNGIGHHGPIFSRTVLDIGHGQVCGEKREDLASKSRLVGWTDHMFASLIWRAGKRARCGHPLAGTRFEW